MPNVSVATSLTRLDKISVQQAEVLAVHIKNTGLVALNAFELRGRAGNDPALGFVTIQSANFAVPGLHCIYASSEPGVLAAGAECILYVTPGYLQDIELRASVASGTTDVLVEVQRSEG